MLDETDTNGGKATPTSHYAITQHGGRGQVSAATRGRLPRRFNHSNGKKKKSRTIRKYFFLCRIPSRGECTDASRLVASVIGLACLLPWLVGRYYLHGPPNPRRRSRERLGGRDHARHWTCSLLSLSLGGQSGEERGRLERTGLGLFGPGAGKHIDKEEG